MKDSIEFERIGDRKTTVNAVVVRSLPYLVNDYHLKAYKEEIDRSMCMG